MRKVIIGIVMMMIATSSLGVMVNRGEGLEFEEIKPLIVKENVIIYDEKFNWEIFISMVDEFLKVNKQAKSSETKELTVEIEDFGRYKVYYNLTPDHLTAIFYDSKGDKNIVLTIQEISEIVKLIDKVKM